MSQKGFAPLVFILVLGLLSAGIIVGSYYYSKMKQPLSVQNSSVNTINDKKLQNIASSSSNPKTITNDPTASWKVFTDKNNIYSIKYPGDTFIRIFCQESKSELMLAKRVPNDKVDVIELQTCERKPDFEIISDAEDLYKKFLTKPTSDENIKFNGINFVKYTFSKSISVTGKTGLSFSYSDQLDWELSEQMISTFKLLDERFYRDIIRLQDLSMLNNAMDVVLQEADIDFKKFNIFCKGLGNPSNCVGTSLSNDKFSNGDGWVKMDLTGQKTVPLTELPVDPLNNQSFHYIYCANENYWEINAVFELPQWARTMKNDGGDDDSKYEVGPNLTVSRQNPQCKY